MHIFWDTIPPLLLRLEDHLSNFLRHFCNIDISAFMMIDKFHNGDLAFELCEESLYPFWFLESFLPIFIPHLTSHASVNHKDECLGFIYILCTLLCCKERSSLQQNKTKTRNTRQNAGKLGSSEKSSAERCLSLYMALAVTSHTHTCDRVCSQKPLLWRSWGDGPSLS